MHMRAISALEPTDAQVRATADNWVALQSTVQVTSVIYRSVRIKRMTPFAFDEIIHAPSTAVGASGTIGTNTTLAVVLTKRTGVAGRTHRGRFYLAGFQTNWGTDVIDSGTGPTSLATFATALITKFGFAGTDPTMQAGVYSRTIGGSFPFTLPGWQLITRWDPQPIIGNQRRRRLNVGI
jgi:hypothetical protein